MNPKLETIQNGEAWSPRTSYKLKLIVKLRKLTMTKKVASSQMPLSTSLSIISIKRNSMSETKVVMNREYKHFPVEYS